MFIDIGVSCFIKCLFMSFVYFYWLVYLFFLKRSMFTLAISCSHATGLSCLHRNRSMGFAIHQHESAMGIHVFPILNPYHPSGSSQCTSPKHPVSCIEPRLVIHFLYDIHVSMPFSQIIPPSPSESKSPLYNYKQCCNEHWGTCVSFNSGFLGVYAQQWDCWVIR